MKFFGILFWLLSCFAVYLSHPNQNLLSKSLPKMVRYLGYIGLVFALSILIYRLPILVAIVMCSAMAIFIWSFAPFLPLFKRSFVHEK